MPSSALTLASRACDVKDLLLPPERALLESTPHHRRQNKLWVTSLRCLRASLGLKSRQDSHGGFQQQHLIHPIVPSQCHSKLGIVPLPFWGNSGRAAFQTCTSICSSHLVLGFLAPLLLTSKHNLLLVAVTGTCSVPRIQFLLLPIFNKFHCTALLFNVSTLLSRYRKADELSD